jgi:hypothetical protein
MLLAACMALSRFSAPDKFDRRVWISYVVFGYAASWLISPGISDVHAVFALVSIASLIVFFRCGENGRKRATMLIVSSMIFSFTIYSYWPRNLNVGDWPTPEGPLHAETLDFSAHKTEVGNSRLVLIPHFGPCESTGCIYASGAIGLWESGRMINGYTPIPAISYVKKLGFNVWSWSAPSFIERYFRKDEQSGLMLFELMRINEVRVVSRPLNDAFRSAKSTGWEEERTELGRIYRHVSKRVFLPGTLAWFENHLKIHSISAATSLEQLEVDSSSGAGRVVFARAWYPGYRAELNGIELPVKRHEGFIVALDVPAGMHGVLTLRFLPPGFYWTMPLALFACLSVCGVAFRDWLRQRSV